MSAVFSAAEQEQFSEILGLGLHETITHPYVDGVIEASAASPHRETRLHNWITAMLVVCNPHDPIADLEDIPISVREQVTASMPSPGGCYKEQTLRRVREKFPRQWGILDALPDSITESMSLLLRNAALDSFHWIQAIEHFGRLPTEARLVAHPSLPLATTLTAKTHSMMMGAVHEKMANGELLLQLPRSRSAMIDLARSVEPKAMLVGNLAGDASPLAARGKCPADRVVDETTGLTWLQTALMRAGRVYGLRG